MSIFNKVIDRRQTQSVKWDMLEQVYQLEDASEILPMWVADMDFKAPEAVISAIEEKIAHGIFGYSYVCESCKKAIVDWHNKRYGWAITADSILFHQGVVPAIASIIETFTEPGDKVGMMSPVYPPFFNIPTTQKREVRFAQLNEQDDIYSIDFEKLEAVLQEVKLFILCNPHNPAGIVWSKNDLNQLLMLAKRYDVLVLSDEIHCDLVFDEWQHTPVLSLEAAQGAKVITTIAPTKTFNLAGIQAAMMVVPNETLREKLTVNSQSHGQGSLNVFASAAVQAAYSECESWLEELLQYLSINIAYVIEHLGSVQGLKIRKPQGTYLVWIDYRETGLTEQQMMDKLLNVGKLALEPGTKYGEAGRGFLRMNIACPIETVKDGVERFKVALQ